jgi:dimethylamine/trimethylamine dehydrogenase
MVSQIRRGVLDMIGAARPSIADPFLPKKIENGDIDDNHSGVLCAPSQVLQVKPITD